MKQVHSSLERSFSLKIQLYGIVHCRVNWFKTFYFEIIIDLQEFAKKVQESPVQASVE